MRAARQRRAAIVHRTHQETSHHADPRSPHRIARRRRFRALQQLKPCRPAKKDTGYYVIAEINAKPGSESPLRDLLVPFARSSRREPGCRVYTLMEVIAEPGRFLTFERWTNKEALEAHMVTPAIKAIVPKLEPLLAKPFTQIFLGGLAGTPADGA